MYPSLFYFFKDIFGVEIGAFKIAQTYGFFLALGIAAGAYVVYLEFKRLKAAGVVQGVLEQKIIGAKASIGELITNGIFGALLGWKAVYLLTSSVAQDNPQEALLSWDGSIIGLILGAFFFAGLQYWQSNKNALSQPKEIEELVFPHQRIGDIIVIGAIFGILGSKMFTFVEDWGGFMADPIGHLTSFSGLTFYGAPFGALIPMYIYMKRKKVPFIRFLDTVALGLLMGYAVGRLGCHFAGDGDWGIVNTAVKPAWFIFPDWAWAYDYPNNVNQVGVPIADCVGKYCNKLPQPVYPTSIWETTFGFLIFGVLWSIRKHITHIPGLLFSIYLIMNGIERFLIEFIRVNDRYTVLGSNFSQAQIIALSISTLGVGLAAYFFWKRSKQKPDTPAPPEETEIAIE